MTVSKYDLKTILNPEEQEVLNMFLSGSPEGVRAFLKVVNQFVDDRGQAVLKESDTAKLLARKSEYDGASRLAREIGSFLGSKSHVVE
jgi:hypothetical protein